MMGFITFLHNGIAIVLLNDARKNTQNQKTIMVSTKSLVRETDRQTDQEIDEATYAITNLYKLPDGQTDRQKKHTRAGTFTERQSLLQYKIPFIRTL